MAVELPCQDVLELLGCTRTHAPQQLLSTHAHTHTPSVTVTHSLFQFAVQRLYVYYSQSQLTSQTVDLCVSFWILVAVGSFSRLVAFPSSLKNR